MLPPQGSQYVSLQRSIDIKDTPPLFRACFEPNGVW